MSPEEGRAARDLPPDVLSMVEGAAESLDLLTFTKNPDRTRTDPVSRHPLDGSIVFPDKRRQGGSIKAGETYFCALRGHETGSGSTIYYADPVIRVDPSFLFDLRPDQVAKLVDALLETSKEPLLEQARAQIRAQVERAVKSEMDALARERDDARAALGEARAELARSREEVARLQLESAGLTDRVRELEEAATAPAPAALAGDGEAGGPAPPAPAGGPTPWTAVEGPQALDLTVVRHAAEQLVSPLLSYGRYFVHVSPDRRVLLVRPHPDGNLPAVGGRLTVPSLGMLRPFSGPEELSARTDPRTGGLLVDIS